ncbi:MAG TPA: alpha/beta fold hydrolase, partial [Chloroflexota bacterium]
MAGGRRVRHITGSFGGASGEELFEQRWVPEQPARAVVAIVHGLGEHSGRYSTVIDALTPRGYIISSFDLRGHGRSPGARGHITSWEEYRDDVRRFIRRAVAE